jgi:hypothetical protein
MNLFLVAGWFAGSVQNTLSIPKLCLEQSEGVRSVWLSCTFVVFAYPKTPVWNTKNFDILVPKKDQ